MAKLDLDAKSLDELWDLHERISKILSARIIAEKQELEKRLAQLGGGKARVSGVLVALDTKSGRQTVAKRKYPQVFPKYQNPNDHNVTWSGRGKQPRWLVSALKAGGKIDQFLIPENDGRLRARGG